MDKSEEPQLSERTAGSLTLHAHSNIDRLSMTCVQELHLRYLLHCLDQLCVCGGGERVGGEGREGGGGADQLLMTNVYP